MHPSSQSIRALVLLLMGAALSLPAAQPGAVLAGQTIWIEAEKPVASNYQGFSTSSMGKPALLSSGQWILKVVSGEEIAKTIPAEGIVMKYEVVAEKSGPYAFWMRLGYYRSRADLQWRIGNGPWNDLTRDAPTVNLMNLGLFCEASWAHLGEVTLPKGATTLEIRWPRIRASEGEERKARMLMAMDCFAFIQGPFTPEGPFKPGETYSDALSQKAAAQVFELPPGTLINASNPAQSRYQKLAQLARKETWEGTKYRVYTINDTISQIEQVVQILNTVSTVILVVLFLIILVGILNTFRIIIYERTKEIGTMRALGLQRPDVRNLFILEATFLAIGGVIAGFAAAGIVMLLLSFINFGTGTFFALFMKNGHLSFVPQLSQSSFHVILVVLLTMLAAYLPARRAAKLEPADALRTSK